MRTVEVALLAGAGAVVVLQSPAARAAAVRSIAGAGRVAGPVAARAAGAARQSAARRYDTVRACWADRSPARPIPCLDPDCDWTQTVPSSAELLEHLRTGHGPAGESAGTAPPPATASTPDGRRLRPVVDAPAERVDEVAPGVRISRQIEQVIDKIGSHMDQFRAVTRALNAAGEAEPKSLLALLDALTGVLSTLAGTANMITDIAEHADTEMYVDLRAVGPLYEAASGVMAESETIRRAMKRIHDLYAEEIAVEHKQADGKVRTLNPKVVASAA
jgi:hypothetical protein